MADDTAIHAGTIGSVLYFCYVKVRGQVFTTV